MLRIIMTIWLLALGSVPFGAIAANDDAHFIQPDDYFINEEPLGRHSYIYIDLAKMITAPSAGTKDEGEFMQLKNGQNMWTAHIWQSRIAEASELRMGQHFIAFHDNQVNGVYQAPKAKESARGYTWWYGKITDLSDIHKGYVTVAGNYKIAVSNIRIPIPYGSKEAARSAAPVPAPVAAPAPRAAQPEPAPAEPAVSGDPLPGEWNGGDWKEVAQGGCDGGDVKRSKGGGVPDDDFCDAEWAGKIAICWEDGCTYKRIPPKQCKNGKKPGRMYVCVGRK